MTALPYPVRVEGRLDPRLSRWKWLVKWLLALPHVIVLAVLWIAFVLVSVVAFFAILFTARYPRSLFDFNLGVLRWSWRVGYYAFGVLATDRYPPFTLAEVPGYPAHFDVVYPQRLSRGLVLVKWWLLALPHYIVVGLFFSGGAWVMLESGRQYVQFGALASVLAVIAVIALLFTGKYPRGLFALLLGLHRWALRVTAYAALMTDRYPPFRLDQGGQEPSPLSASVNGTEGPSPAADVPAPSSPPVRMTPGRIVSLVLGALLVLAGLPGVFAGTGLLIADRAVRDDDGFVMTGARPYGTSLFAVVQHGLQGIDDDGPEADWLRGAVGEARVRATSTNGKSLFLGVAPEAEARSYLATIGYDEISGARDGVATYTRHLGGPGVTPPAAQAFWTVRAEGTGPQTVTWKPSSSMMLVAMNADNSAIVAVRADVGAELPVLRWAGVVLLCGGAVLLLAGVLLMVLALRRRTRAG